MKKVNINGVEIPINEDSILELRNKLGFPMDYVVKPSDVEKERKEFYKMSVFPDELINFFGRYNNLNAAKILNSVLKNHEIKPLLLATALEFSEVLKAIKNKEEIPSWIKADLEQNLERIRKIKKTLIRGL